MVIVMWQAIELVTVLAVAAELPVKELEVAEQSKPEVKSASP
ncbi:MAG TPA: hypothetical protein V6C84_30305 [Coleofasciculaceae cyanobacterium]|jgi:hypothetical protein